MRILLLEDDRIQAMDTRDSLQELGYSDIHTAHSAPEAIALLETYQPDIALLDIHLGKGNATGLDVARHINKQSEIPIIFWTSKKELFLSEADMPHASFFEKNTDMEVLAHNMRLAVERAERLPSALPKTHLTFIWKRRKMDIIAKVPINDVIFIKADQGNVDIYTSHRSYKGVPLTLKHFGDKSLYPSFFRIHHSFVLQTEHPAITGCATHLAFLEMPPYFASEADNPKGTTEAQLPISRQYQAAFKEHWSAD